MLKDISLFNSLRQEKGKTQNQQKDWGSVSGEAISLETLGIFLNL
jgi:hypothetical protein